MVFVGKAQQLSNVKDLCREAIHQVFYFAKGLCREAIHQGFLFFKSCSCTVVIKLTAEVSMINVIER